MAEPFDPASANEPLRYEISLPGTSDPKRNLVLMPSRDVTLFPQQDYERILNRAKTIWNATAQGDLVSGAFVMDLAQSPFSDDEILEYAHARRRFLQDRSLWGRVRSIGAEPLDWVNNATEFVIRNTVDKQVQFMLGDSSATAAGAAYLLFKGNIDDYEKFKDEAPEGNDMAAYLQGDARPASSADSLLYMIASVVTDPTVFVPGAGQVSKAARLISVGTKLESKTSKIGRFARMLGFRTDPSKVVDVVRLGRGEQTISAFEAWRSGRLSAWMKSRVLGSVPAERKMAEDLLLYGTDRGTIQSLLPNTDLNSKGTVMYLLEARNKAVRSIGGESALRSRAAFNEAFASFSDDYAKLFDGRLWDDLSVRLSRLEIEADQLDGTLREFQRLASGNPDAALTSFASGRGATMGAEQARSIAPLMVPSLERRQRQVAEALDAFRDFDQLGSFERLPRRRVGEAMRRYADGTDAGVQFGEWAPNFSGVTRAMLGQAGSRRSRITATLVERATAMNPHANIRVDSPNWSEQVRRMGQEYEFLIDDWGRADTARLVDQALEVGDDLELAEFIQGAQVLAYERLGIAQDQVRSLVKRHGQAGGDIVRNVRKGKGTSEALFSPQALNKIAVMDPRLMRAAARRVKLKRKGEFGGKVARGLQRLDDSDFTAILDAANSTWKSLAAARPAYLFRVVILSEMGRMAAAGGVTPLGSPLAWLNAAYPGRGGRVAGRLRKILDDLGVETPADWDDGLEAFANFDDAGSAEALKAMRDIAVEPGTLGTQFNPNHRLASFAHAVDIEGPGTTVFAEMVSEGSKRQYVKAWGELLRKDIAPDPVVRQFLVHDRPVDEIIEWFTKEGRDYARQMGIEVGVGKWRKQAHAFLAKQRQVFDDMTRGDVGLKQRIAAGKITFNELLDLEPPPKLPVQIAGKYAGLSGPEIATKFVNESVLGKMWDQAGWFSHQVVRRGAYRGEFVRQVARQSAIARKAGTEVDFRKIIRHASDQSVTLTRQERAVFNASRNTAEQFVKQTVYDLAETARWTDLARFIFPFGNAWQEEITRWFQIAMNRPGTPAFMFSSAKALAENPSFTWQDPSTGKRFLFIPMSEHITSFATGKWNPFTKGEEGLSMRWSIGWDNLNMLQSGGSFGIGAGPWLQIPAEVAAKMRPQWRDNIKTLFPFADSSISNTIIPSVFWREMASGKVDDEVEAGQAVRDVFTHYALQPPSERPSNETIQSVASMLQTLNTMLAIGFGGGMKASLPPAVREQVEFLEFLREDAPDVASRAFLDGGGAEFLEQLSATHAEIVDNPDRARLALATQLTGITQPRADQPTGPVTTQRVELMLNPRFQELREKHPEAFWDAFSTLLPGADFDAAEYKRQIASGERDVLTLEQFRNQVSVRVGWAEYGRLFDAREQMLDAAGIRSRSAKAAEPIMDAFRARLEALQKDNPVWGDAYDDWSDRQGDRKRALLELESLRKEPEFADAPLGEFLNIYFAARTLIRAQMLANDFASLDAAQAFNVRTRWRQANERLVGAFPQMRPLYERLLRLDPMDFDVEVMTDGES